MKIKGAIFDMDGTLVDSLSFWPQYWKKFGKQYFNEDNFIPGEDIDKKVRTTIFTQAVLYVKKYYHLTVSDEEILAFSRAGIDEFYNTQVTVKKGVIEFLEYLKSRSIPMCVASATEKKHVMMALTQYGINKYFDHILSCADIGKNKDQPDIYLLAQKTLNFPIGELCVFEDSFVAIETAKNAGFLTVGIFDSNNFDQDRLARSSDIYLGDGHGMDELISMID